MTRPRLAAYVLAADPTWVRSSVSRYYDYVDLLVVSASENGAGWTGAPIRADECVAAILELDHRGIVEVIRGSWIDQGNPMRADTAQRQHAIDIIGDRADWILQLDTDELVPDVEALIDVIEQAATLGIDAVEWPMRVLFRRLSDGRYLEVVGRDGGERFDYPAPIAVRSGAQLTDARRTSGPFVRPVVEGDSRSLQIIRAPEAGEHRGPTISAREAILHNSWARSPRDVRAKVRSWGHGGTWRASAFYWAVWIPAPLTWRWLRSFHPLSRDLWPRLARLTISDVADLDRRDGA